MSRPGSSLLATALLLGAGCIEPFETPSEYDSQRFLCDEAHQEAWEDLVSSCADDDACGGVVSFKGKLEGVPVVVESTQPTTAFRRVRRAEGDAVVLDRIDSFGASPYFEFGIKMKSVGGDAESEAPAAREMSVDSAAERREDAFDDDVLTFDLRLTSGGESVDLTGLKGGTVKITAQGPEELQATFATSFGAEADRVEGCFALFPTDVSSSDE